MKRRLTMFKHFLKYIKEIFTKKEDNVFYIGGGENLPAPLQREEENLLLYDIKNVKNRNILIEHNLRLVVYIAKKFENTGINIEDLISIGTIGLIKAINTFNPQKNIKLATYASRCIENEILMHLRKVSSHRNEISIDEPLNTDKDGNELLLSDILGSEIDMIQKTLDEQTDKVLLLQAMEKLSAREKTIMQLRYGLKNDEEMTQKEVADILGISQSYISRLEKRIISRLRAEISKLID